MKDWRMADGGWQVRFVTWLTALAAAAAEGMGEGELWPVTWEMRSGGSATHRRRLAHGQFVNMVNATRTCIVEL